MIKHDFFDSHVEHDSLRDWTLPVASVRNRCYCSNVYSIEGISHSMQSFYGSYMNYNADKWSPLYGVGEGIVFIK